MAPQKNRRLHHKKSRLGCVKCKERKIKCDEVRPICENCQRAGHDCHFNTVAAASSNTTAPHPNAANGTRSSAAEDQSGESASASRQDRLLELQLMHHYTAVTSRESFIATHDAAVRDLYTYTIPAVALKHEPLLSAIFAVAALHLYKLDPSKTEYADVHRRYLEVALKSQRHAVESISSENADGVCLTASMIANLTLSTRLVTQEDYQPPSLWFDLASTHHTLFKTAWDLILESTRLVCIIEAEPNLQKFWRQLRPGYPAIFPPDPESFFPNILEFHDPAEIMDEERRSLYRFVLGYIAHSLQYIQDNEDPSKSRRRLTAFAAFSPVDYNSLVRQRQPRALITLAYYFSVLKAVDDIWWLRGIPEREVFGIQGILPDRWQWAMAWPIQKIALFTASVIPIDGNEHLC